MARAPGGLTAAGTTGIAARLPRAARPGRVSPAGPNLRLLPCWWYAIADALGKAARSGA
ncbi:hypothetical protein [Streptomyces sp. NPDC051162]|uniref:hypothetical protein n=1 Tax=unclassified Streptomyces TaxID=2593676 RepID=UPI0034157617